MRWGIMRAVIRKDVRSLNRNRNALIPMFMLPLIMFIIVPIAMLTMGYMMSGQAINTKDILTTIPSGLIPSQYTGVTAIVYAVLIYYLAPLYMLLPALIANVAASASFVGEKEDRTLEGLISSPITTRELVMAKSIASLIPTMGCSLITGLLYTLIIDIGGGRLFHALIFPNTAWVIIMLLTTPLTAIMAIELVTFISQHAKTVMDAQGTGMIVLIPFIGILVAQTSGSMNLDIPTVIIATITIAISDIALLWFVIRATNAEGMLLRQ